MVKQDIRKVIVSPYFYISIALVAVFLYMGSAGEKAPDFLYLYWCARFAGMTSFIMPLLSGLAVADMYCVERRDGYHYCLLMRSDTATYCLSKIFVAALTGLLVAVLGVVVFAVICMCTVDGTLHLATEQAMGQDYPREIDATASFMEKLGAERNWWGMLSMHLIVLGVYSMIWPVMSLAVAVFTRNRYLVVAFPVLYVNLMHTIMPLLNLDRFNPIMLAEFSSSIYLRSLPWDGIPFQMGSALVYILVCSIIFRIGVGKELK